MKLNHFARRDISWLKPSSISDSSVISTRIRLARNINGCPMPGRADSDEMQQCLNSVFKAAEQSSFFRNSKKIILKDCSEIDLRLLLERHLISHGHAVSAYGGVIIDEREQMSIMVNEEDHLRIQFISSGLNLFDSWEVISRADDELSQKLEFAYSDKFGYLTACPTNTGTGMRASCQLHLPGLGMTGSLAGTMENINKMGMVVRGLYGEGTRVMGNVLQISNQVTLGVSERRIIDSLKRLVSQVIAREKKVCAGLYEADRESLKDAVCRSHGLLVNAHKISFEEALDLMSTLRFGVYTGMLKCDLNMLNNLMIAIQPSHIEQIENLRMSDSERDIARARIIRDTLRKNSV